MATRQYAYSALDRRTRHGRTAYAAVAYARCQVCGTPSGAADLRDYGCQVCRLRAEAERREERTS